MKLQTDLVLSHRLARQAGPLQRDLAFLDVLLRRATLIVEAEDLLGFQGQVGDEKANAREEFAGMPFRLGEYPAGVLSR